MKVRSVALTAAAAGLLLAPAGAAFAQQAPPEPPGPASCKNVALVTDSLGVNLHPKGTGVINKGAEVTSALTKSLANAPSVESVTYDILPARSMHEKVADGTNGVEALQAINAKNKDIDCYVMQMGTNDAANIAVGSNFTAEQRIDAALKNTNPKARVIWVAPMVAAKATVQGYTPEGTQKFATALQEAEKKENRLTVLDLPAEAKKAAGKDGLPANVDDFFVDDGIHYKGDKVTYWQSDLIVEALKSPETPATGNDADRNPTKADSGNFEN